MLNPLKKRDSRLFENSIGIRLLRYVFGCYLVVTILVTCIQLVAEYRHVKDGIFDELVNLEHTFKHSFGESVWTFDTNQLASTLKGMSEIDIVVGIKILDDKGNLISSIGLTKEIERRILDSTNSTTPSKKERRTSLTDGLYEYSFPIIYLNKNVNVEQVIGYGKIYSDDSIVVERVKYGFTLIIINSVIKTVALWFIFLYFTRNILAIPLNTLIKRTVDLTQSQSKESNDINEKVEFKDELTCLSSRFNDMQQVIVDKIEIIESHNESLETRVQERTEELLQLNNNLTKTLDELQQTQSKLIQSEKLSALGSLVAGISHELNTPVGNGLTAISFLSEATQLVKKKMREGITRSELDKYVDEMEEGTEIVGNSLEKSSALLASFKQISVDRSTSQRRTFFLNEIIEDTNKTLRPLFRNSTVALNIDIEKNIEMDSFPGPIGEILNNLVKNSLTHGLKDIAEGKITLKVTQEGEKVIFVYSDNGAGIEEGQLTRVFDPFFTTQLGQGKNGLGLHIVHNIVNGVLGGSISVSSEVNSHTTFALEFPIIAPGDNA